MANVPDELVLARHRDLQRREREHWTRRVLLGLLAGVVVLAAANVFGQKPSTSTASIASVAQVQWAVLETGAKIRFIRKGGGT